MEQKELQKKWIWPENYIEAVDISFERFALVERQLLQGRGIHTSQAAEAFLGNAPPEVDDPFLLSHMDRTVQRIINAMEADERIVIYGDYDADGITATTLLIEALKGEGIKVEYYIPDRMTEGYGLNNEALINLKSSGADLVITVDCGIRAIEEIQNAKSLGLDVIVTDHHAPGPEIPEAYAIINPKQQGDSYPFKGFAGVGIAYKVSQAIKSKLGEKTSDGQLELVAIGTIADLAPLVGENRYLVAEGLQSLNETNRLGLKALAEIAGVSNKTITADTVGFVLGPRINAAGRLESAAQALELLLTTDQDRAKDLAQELDTINRRRQKLTGEIVELARMQVIDQGRVRNLIFAAHPEFHEGIVGLAASRLTEEFYKPAIVATMGEEFTRGSARSIPGFHITEAFDYCADILQQYGGHSAAAGFTVPTSELDNFWERLEIFAEDKMANLEVIPSVEIEAVVSFSDINNDLLEFVERLQPCGIGNPKPLFGARDVQVLNKRGVGRDQNHLKLMLKSEGRIFDSIAFRKGYLTQDLPSIIDIAFYIERNVYMGYESIQLNIQEIRWG
jgi:single-stranded-DNA-specific exonuclease